MKQILTLGLFLIVTGCSNVERDKIAEKAETGIEVKKGDVVHVMSNDTITPYGQLELNITQSADSDVRTVKVISGSGLLVRDSGNY